MLSLPEPVARRVDEIVAADQRAQSVARGGHHRRRIAPARRRLSTAVAAAAIGVLVGLLATALPSIALLSPMLAALLGHGGRS